MNPTVEKSAPPVRAALPGDVVRTPDGDPAVVVVRTGRGWTVLGSQPSTGWVEAAGNLPGDGDELTLVEAMSLADLVAGELGVTPEPDREARRAARASSNGGPTSADEPADPKDEEITGLRRTVGQLEHALAARVSIERAIGVLAERHATTPREAFEELRRRARAQGRPAQELAVEVLDGLTPHSAVPGQRSAPTPTIVGGPGVPAPEPRPADRATSSRRVQRNPRRTGGGDSVPEARS
jgi:hypothetical protein